MAPSIAYEKDCEKKEAERLRNVKYDARGKDHCYTNLETDKNVEDRCRVKYLCGSGADAVTTACATKTGASRCDAVKRRKGSKCSSSDSGGSRRSCVTVAPAASKEAASGPHAIIASSKGQTAHRAALDRQEELCGRAAPRKLTPTEVSAACYEVRRASKKYQPCRTARWQHGKYVRDECGSGIVPVRFDIGPCKKLWCKTPLSMYQATIGELGRQLLCREKIIQRDVWPEPPCNVAEYIMPPCRGYYRKYDCMRPCEEDHAYIKQGKKYYRDRVERYWEPCLTQEQKHTLNLNEYGPHNAALALKLRRENMGIPCW
ncbi:hypothetical protein V9T40_006019 [Parthenolecanium corni]|uniref:Uncharacterized protein n=1 Tax=Parthenolecanium corni TaxID=536013 RepID=A0AAN9Y965_9HEMI